MTSPKVYKDSLPHSLLRCVFYNDAAKAVSPDKDRKELRAQLSFTLYQEESIT